MMVQHDKISRPENSAIKWIFSGFDFGSYRTTRWDFGGIFSIVVHKMGSKDIRKSLKRANKRTERPEPRDRSNYKFRNHVLQESDQ